MTRRQSRRSFLRERYRRGGQVLAPGAPKPPRADGPPTEIPPVFLGRTQPRFVPAPCQTCIYFNRDNGALTDAVGGVLRRLRPDEDAPGTCTLNPVWVAVEIGHGCGRHQRPIEPWMI